MARKKNVLEPHYLQFNQSLATSNFCMMITENVFSRLQSDYTNAAEDPRHSSKMFAGSCLEIREDREEKYPDGAQCIMYLPGAGQSVNFSECTVFFGELNAQTQLAELTNCYEAWEQFIRHTLAVLLYQKRNSIRPEKIWEKAVESKPKNTPSYFVKVAERACRYNSDAALAYLSKHVPSLRDRARRYISSDLYLYVKAIAIVRHTKVHSNGFIDVDGLKTAPEVREFIHKLIAGSVTSGGSRLKMTEKVASKLSCRLAEFGRVVYQTTSDFCGFLWKDDFDQAARGC